jgi:antitoxin component YwqK of YwqJK toxin-antitoxin module
LHRLYDQSGRIDFEKLYDPRRKFFTQITYHPNGKIRHIAYYQNDIIGRAQTFDIDGNPTQSKDYDENGHEIK